MDNSDKTRNLPVLIRTGGASVVAGLFRIVLTPVDTVKTILQVEGKEGLKLLAAKVKIGGPTVMFHGALATASATIVGHYPWYFLYFKNLRFATFNFLNEKIPDYKETYKKLGRRAFIGFISSVISDSISNSLRVIKTTK